MMWNLQSYQTTVLNEIMWTFLGGQNILWLLLQGVKKPQPLGSTLLDGINRKFRFSTCRTCDVPGSTLAAAISGSDSGQVVRTCVPLLPSSIISVAANQWWSFAAGKVTLRRIGLWVTVNTVYPRTGAELSTTPTFRKEYGPFAFALLLLTTVHLETVCRESPSTYVTDATVQNVDYSDPLFPPPVHAEQRRNGQPHVDVQDVSPFDDNDNGGVGA